jgi:polyphosphate kinase
MEVISKLWARLPFISKARRARTASTQPARLTPVKAGSERLFNREISDLLFIQRIMEESLNQAHPLFERVRFLAIAADVLDQFFTVRVAKLKRSVSKNDGYVTPDEMTPRQQLVAVRQKADALITAQQAGWVHLQQELLDLGVVFADRDQLSADDLDWLTDHFRSHFLPVLTPYTIDEEHPFPFVASGGLCIVLELGIGHILVPLPSNLPRFIAIPGRQPRFVSAEVMIHCCRQDLFPDEALRSFGVFQILRDNDLAKEERSEDLRAVVEQGLRMRYKANVILLTVSPEMTEAATKFVCERLGLLSRKEIQFIENRNDSIASSDDVYCSHMPGLSDISETLGVLGEKLPGFVFPTYKPREAAQFENDCFAAIRDRDILVHWPYESFNSVVRFLEQSASDPQVVAIKQTLYRIDDESSVVEALIAAASNGKTVLAVIELEVRDNQEANIMLAKRMEAAGVQIVYGIIGLKIHCKATLVVRMEDERAVTYTHLGSGNYHPRNARTYTDISFFSFDQAIGSDMSLVFNYLTSGKLTRPDKLLVAPGYLRQRLSELIDREIEHAVAGRPAHICIKVNSLTDTQMVEHLYRASESGVEIDLIVRRHCVLRPGLAGLSSRIRVKSVVGRFLEHSRIYLFSNGQAMASESADVFFGSPDLMERNLDERVELLVPLEDSSVRELVVNGIMGAYLRDISQSWYLDGENLYTRESTEGFCAQEFFMAEEDPSVLGSFPQPEAAMSQENARNI